MRIESSSRPGGVVDLDTNVPVPEWIWVDVSAGLVEAFFVPFSARADGTFATFTARGRFKYTPDPPKKLRVRVPKVGADCCEKCGSWLTLPDDELCVNCRIKERNRRFPARLDDPFTDHKCEVCSRQATWSVGDEVQASPQKQIVTQFGRRRYRGNSYLLYDRGDTVGRRYFCDWHFQGPRVLDDRGEIIETLETSIRPSWHS